MTQLTQVVDYYAEVRQRFDFNATQLSVTESTGGAVVHSFYFDQIVSGPNGCGIRQATEPAVWLYICQSGGPDKPLTVLMYSKFAGEGNYFSIGDDLQWHRSAGGGINTPSSYLWDDVKGFRKGTTGQWGADY